MAKNTWILSSVYQDKFLWASVLNLFSFEQQRFNILRKNLFIKIVYFSRYFHKIVHVSTNNQAFFFIFTSGFFTNILTYKLIHFIDCAMHAYEQTSFAKFWQFLLIK